MLFYLQTPENKGFRKKKGSKFDTTLLLVKEKIGREEFEALFDSREICKQDNHVMEN